ISDAHLLSPILSIDRSSLGLYADIKATLKLKHPQIAIMRRGHPFPVRRERDVYGVALQVPHSRETVPRTIQPGQYTGGSPICTVPRCAVPAVNQHSILGNGEARGGDVFS